MRQTPRFQHYIRGDALSAPSSGAMEHNTIEDENLVERYVLGDLTLEERERFEAHFLDCPRCLGELEWTEDMAGALRAATAESAGRALAVGAGAFLARRGRFARAALAFVALALPTVLTLAFFLPRNRNLERRIASAEQAAAVARQPEVNVPGVLLGVLVRGADAAGEVIPLRSSERQRVMLEIDGEAVFPSYRATLFDAGGEPIWEERLRPNLWAVLEITFPAGFLAPGDYRLDFAGMEDDGRAVLLGSFPLRAEP